MQQTRKKKFKILQRTLFVTVVDLYFYYLLRAINEK